MNAYFVLFNNPFEKFARASIQTFLEWHPDWKVEAFVVNTIHNKVADGIFTDKRVNVTFIDQKFLGFDKERLFCNSERFNIFAANAGKYKKIITTDADIIFRKRLTEIEDQLDTNEICLYVDEEADPKNRAGASFLAYRPTRRMLNFWERYRQILKSKRPFWWNDQICLFETYMEFKNRLKVFVFPYKKYCFSGLDENGLRKCEVIQPRGPKDSAPLSSYRQMVDEIVGRKHKMNVLVLGSGLSGEQVKNLDLSNHYVIAINNAWKLTPFWTHHLYPDDFPGPFCTTLNQIQQKIESSTYLKYNLKWGNQEFRGNSMIYNALYFALQFDPDVIGTLGCDLYYPKDGDTHFYGKGSPDPMRYPPAFHALHFKRFLDTCQKEKVKCVNFSGELKGLNPFPQASFPHVIT